MYYKEVNGVPVQCSSDEWARVFEKNDRHVALTKHGNDIISTVFIGIDMSFGGGEPQIYETLLMVSGVDEDMFRYSTRQEALAKHQELVKKYLPQTLTNSLPETKRPEIEIYEDD